ncbi:hypothetical protein GF322_01235 [Candidatus Dependentiae bacterium]|nr:hypothetical protein [Candidatus Dependentiae bacterium]
MSAKHVGVKLPDDLLNVLKRKNTVAILATFSEKGIPNTTPIQCIYPKGEESILMTIHKEHTGYHNMVWQKKVMLNFLCEGNIAYSILGRAGVVRAPSTVHPLMNVVRIDIIDIKSDRSILTRVDQGVLWSYTSDEAEELHKSLFAELEDLSRTL